MNRYHIALLAVILSSCTGVSQNNDARTVGDGVVVHDTLFYSQALGLSFSGNLEKLTFKNNEFRVPEWPGVIRVFQRMAGQDQIAAIQDVVRKAGGSVESCDFDLTEPIPGNAIVQVTPKDAYVPTEEELFEKLKSDQVKTMEDMKKLCATTPECEWTKSGLVTEHNQKVCSEYAVTSRYKDESYFQFSTEADGSKTFVYRHDEVGGGDAPWIRSIDVFPLK